MYVELHAVEKHGGRQELWVPQIRALGMADYCFVGFGCGRGEALVGATFVGAWQPHRVHMHVDARGAPGLAPESRA